jgi:hypothetical protein
MTVCGIGHTVALPTAYWVGYFAGEIIWGRGSADNKNGLIGILYVIPAFSLAAVRRLNSK